MHLFQIYFPLIVSFLVQASYIPLSLSLCCAY